MDDVNDVAQAGLDALTDQMLGPSNETTNESQPQEETKVEVPETPEVQQTTEVAEQAPAEQVEQAPLQNPEQTVATPAEEELQEFQSFEPTYGGVPPLDLTQLPQDEEGNIDPQALAQAMQRRDQAILQQSASMVQQYAEQMEEKELWNKAFEAKPELRSDKALAEEVNALRFGLFASEINAGKQGRMLTPIQAYERLNKRFAQAEAKGAQQATESVKVQESVYTQPTANAGSAKDDTADLFNKMRSSDRTEAEAAADAILRSRLFGE